MTKQVNKVNQSEQVFDAIHSIMHLFRARQLRGLRDNPHELTHMEYKALGFFFRRPGATQGDLVAHSGRDKAQLARLLKGLRDKQLLEATADEADRRITRLSLSAEGQRIFHSLHQLGVQASSAAVTGMNADQLTQLQELLQQIRNNLEADDKM
ncbi:MarR family transcriptional regulator [Duganella dendranthematis]|jgi:DNA-binding MarR family transcriptional regulator|uniref:MarR family transcriptional regulator n=1 Tax=Duganella dendranthematis TaxID=2728021 RepID=A0ABX6MHS0_9BURK|nr:MarR family transcriptional regulator [Duganella dendranthematis]QJD93879.1 MarR family transcriptional regulator [Duganella dendranthematis]